MPLYQAKKQWAEPNQLHAGHIFELRLKKRKKKEKNNNNNNNKNTKKKQTKNI